MDHEGARSMFHGSNSIPLLAVCSKMGWWLILACRRSPAYQQWVEIGHYHVTGLRPQALERTSQSAFFSVTDAKFDTIYIVSYGIF
jgi:hypothetical protein